MNPYTAQGSMDGPPPTTSKAPTIRRSAWMPPMPPEIHPNPQPTRMWFTQTCQSPPDENRYPPGTPLSNPLLPQQASAIQNPLRLTQPALRQPRPSKRRPDRPSSYFLYPTQPHQIPITISDSDDSSTALEDIAAAQRLPTQYQMFNLTQANIPGSSSDVHIQARHLPHSQGNIAPIPLQHSQRQLLQQRDQTAQHVLPIDTPHHPYQPQPAPGSMPNKQYAAAPCPEEHADPPQYRGLLFPVLKLTPRHDTYEQRPHLTTSHTQNMPPPLAANTAAARPTQLPQKRHPSEAHPQCETKQSAQHTWHSARTYENPTIANQGE